MANFTRKAIKETFIELLEKKPLSEITVKDIVETCGINRNSFYYHFQDIPALLEEIIREEAEAIIKKYPSVTTIVECFDSVTEFAAAHKQAIMHVFRSVGRDVFEYNLMMVCEYFVKSYVETALSADSVSEAISDADKKAITDYYKCVLFGLTIDWLSNGMDEAHVKSVRRMFLIKKDTALEEAKLLRNQI